MKSSHISGRFALGIKRATQLVLMALALTSVAACSSSAVRLDTWKGNPEAAAQAATLKAPGSIEVIEVNGRSMKNYLMDDLALDYGLLPGENRVVFSYKSIWAKSGVVENGESKVHVYETEPQVVSFRAEPGAVYSFRFDKPETRGEAEQSLESFSASIVDASGTVVANSSAWEPARTPIPSVESVTSSGVEGDTLEVLKAVWATATEEEKKTFLRWAFE